MIRPYSPTPGTTHMSTACSWLSKPFTAGGFVIQAVSCPEMTYSTSRMTTSGIYGLSIGPHFRDVESSLLPDESLVFGSVVESPALPVSSVSWKTQCPCLPSGAPRTTVPIQLPCASSSSFSFSAPTYLPKRHPTNTILLHPLHNRPLPSEPLLLPSAPSPQPSSSEGKLRSPHSSW